jgi:excisionase family DNA binding protein
MAAHSNAMPKDGVIEPLLKPRDVERWLNVSRRGLQNMMYRGQLPAVKIGNVIRYKRADVEKQFRQPGTKR